MLEKVTQLVTRALVAIRKKKKLVKVKPQHWRILIIWKRSNKIKVVIIHDCLNYFACLGKLCFHEFIIKKSAKTIGNSYFCHINIVSGVKKGHYGPHPTLMSNFVKILIKNLISFPETFYFFGKSLDLIELWIFLHTMWLFIVRNSAISSINSCATSAKLKIKFNFFWR